MSGQSDSQWRSNRPSQEAKRPRANRNKGETTQMRTGFGAKLPGALNHIILCHSSLVI